MCDHNSPAEPISAACPAPSDSTAGDFKLPLANAPCFLAGVNQTAPLRPGDEESSGAHSTLAPGGAAQAERIEWIDLLIVPQDVDRVRISEMIREVGGVLSWHDEDMRAGLPLNAAVGAFPGRADDVRSTMLKLRGHNDPSSATWRGGKDSKCKVN
jgi:hypothetical protein